MKFLSTVIITLLFMTSYAQDNSLLIENVSVIPLHINQVLEHKDVVISNGVITSIRTHIENDTTVYDLGRIDGQGKFLSPAYADAHAHLPDEKDLEIYFLMNLANGVTTLRSMRGKMWHMEIDDEADYTPRLIRSAPPISWRDSISQNAAAEMMAAYKEHGFDFVKVLSVKDVETFDFLVASAKDNNLTMAGHCPSNVGIFNVINSGVYNSIEHLGGFFQLPDQESINLAVSGTTDNDIYHCPTLDWYYTGQVVEDILKQREGAVYLPAELIEKWAARIDAYYAKSTEEEREADRSKSKAKFDSRLSYLEYIYRQGGQLLLSPDASGLYGIPGFGIQTEMNHYANAGISNYDILKSTSYNLSKMNNTQNQWGTIKLGSSSDLVLLHENPLEDISNANKISGVIYRGKYYTQEDLLSRLKSLKE